MDNYKKDTRIIMNLRSIWLPVCISIFPRSQVSR